METTHTTRLTPRNIIAVLTASMLTLFGLQFVSAPAYATEVQPAVTNLSITDLQGNPVETVTNNGRYRIAFDFAIDSAAPGDTFNVTLPAGFAFPASNDVALGDIAVASRLNASTVRVTFTNSVSSLENLRGGFTYLVNYVASPDDGSIVTGEVRVGDESVYMPELKYGTAPGPGPMAISKWSGNSDEELALPGVSPERVRLSGHYGYTEVGASDGQILAKWFIELNNWNLGKDAAGELGDNVVVTDTLQGLGDFVPQLTQLPRAGVDRVLTDAELEGLLTGPFINSRQIGAWGRGIIELTVGHKVARRSPLWSASSIARSTSASPPMLRARCTWSSRSPST